MSRYDYTAVLLLMILLCEPCVAALPPGTGEDWLKWSDETRLIYTTAYVEGRGRGFRDGCEAGEKVYSGRKRAQLPGESCIKNSPTFSGQLEHYVTVVTNYYRTYNSDITVPIFKVLDGLSDSRELTIRQMHQYYGPSPKRN